MLLRVLHHGGDVGGGDHAGHLLHHPVHRVHGLPVIAVIAKVHFAVLSVVHHLRAAIKLRPTNDANIQKLIFSIVILMTYPDKIIL